MFRNARHTFRNECLVFYSHGFRCPAPGAKLCTQVRICRDKCMHPGKDQITTMHGCNPASTWQTVFPRVFGMRAVCLCLLTSCENCAHARGCEQLLLSLIIFTGCLVLTVVVVGVYLLPTTNDVWANRARKIRAQSCILQLEVEVLRPENLMQSQLCA